MKLFTVQCPPSPVTSFILGQNCFLSTHFSYAFSLLFYYMYLASFIVLYYDQQMHNFLTNYHTPTSFDTLASSSGSW